MAHVSRSGQPAYLHNTPPDLLDHLIVSWPNGAPKPPIAFTNPP